MVFDLSRLNIRPSCITATARRRRRHLRRAAARPRLPGVAPLRAWGTTSGGSASTSGSRHRRRPLSAPLPARFRVARRRRRWRRRRGHCARVEPLARAAPVLGTRGSHAYLAADSTLRHIGAPHFPPRSCRRCGGVRRNSQQQRRRCSHSPLTAAVDAEAAWLARRTHPLGELLRRRAASLITYARSSTIPSRRVAHAPSQPRPRRRRRW